MFEYLKVIGVECNRKIKKRVRSAVATYKTGDRRLKERGARGRITLKGEIFRW